MNDLPRPEVVPIEVATFRFPGDEPWAGEEGVVIAHAVRHAEGVLLFDTGFGFGSAELDARYHPIPRPIGVALADAGIAPIDVTAVVNCHLHADHAGQNGRFPGVPTFVQPAELEAASGEGYTIDGWIHEPGVSYVPVAGDHVVAPGVTVLATPGHTPGHQSLAIATRDGLAVLAGQAVYSAGEWRGEPDAREGRTSAPDPSAYDRSVARLRALDPVRVHFAHDRAVWSR